MFRREVHVSDKGDLSYGYTDKEPHDTMNEIMQLLDDNGCSRILTEKQGDNMRIGFVFEGKSYAITVPRVYVNGNYKAKIGVRVVYHFLRILLTWTKQGVVDLDKALLGGRMIKLQGETVTMDEAVEKMPQGELTSTMESELEELPEKEPEEADAAK